MKRELEIQEIESDLDALQASANLYTKEANKLLERWVELKATETMGIPDEFSNGHELVFFENEFFKFFDANPNEHVDTLFVFLHSGLKLPMYFSDMFGFNEWEKIGYSLLENHDIGSRWMLARLINDLKERKHDFTYGIVFYDYSRIAADANRLRIIDQVIDLPYRGEGPWNPEKIDKKHVSQKIIDPFFKKLEEYIKQVNPNFIFHVHTYDTYGGGRASSGHEISLEDKPEKRPASMIFDYYNLYRGNAYGHYHPDKEARFRLMQNDGNLQAVIDSQMEHLSKIEGLDEEIEVTVDFPYTSPPQLPGLIHTYHPDAPQLILENRKDLFLHGREEIYQSLVRIAGELGN